MALTAIDQIDEGGRMDDCIDNCFEAAQASEWCADQCIEMGDQSMARCIRLCRDVADVSTLHARFIVRNSAFESELAALCADLCEECASECAQFDADHCQVCADVLQTCARSCRDMAAA